MTKGIGGDSADGPLLSVRGLTVVARTADGTLPLVRDVSFDVHRGETVGVVGESGSGKSMTCYSILRVLPSNVGIAKGSILLNGRDLATMRESELQRVRGGEVAMILQDPMTSLNPVFSVGNQVMEPIRLHQGLTGRELRSAAIDALTLLHINDPEARLSAYPHQLSGGMRQRVLGAVAMSCEPDLLIADEPTTALDVTVQAQYLSLLQEIQARRSVAILFVTHDMAVVSQICHRIIVMYAGQVVESGPASEVLDRPAHPYTKALLKSVPGDVERGEPLPTIAGQPPHGEDMLAPCPFAPRCPLADARCRVEAPPIHAPDGGRTVACWHPDA